jgi:chloramphenicol-sensitive protein RarD
VDGPTHALLLSAGVITTIPLLLFGYGARRIRLTTLGLLQYLAPSLQLALGVWVYREPFTRERALSFAFIWAALALYTADNLLATRRARA